MIINDKENKQDPLPPGIKNPEIAVGADYPNKMVILDWISGWIALSPNEARQLADALLKEANLIHT